MRAAWSGAARAAAMAVASLATLAAQDSAPRPTFRADVDLTILEVTVRGRDGQLLTDVRQDEFHISRGQTSIPIEQYSRDRQPLTVAVMVSTRGDLPAHVEWARHMVDAIEDDDRVAIGSYGSELALSPLWTSDRRVLRRILDEEMWYGLWLPVAAAFQLGALRMPPEARRPAVVAVGIDARPNVECPNQQPCVTRDDARRVLSTRGVSAYGVVTGFASSIGHHSVPSDTWSVAPAFDPTKEGPLLSLAKATGGYLMTRGLPTPAWPNAAKSILEQLRLRYVLGFAAGQTTDDEPSLTVSRPGATVLVQKRRVGTSRP